MLNIAVAWLPATESVKTGPLVPPPELDIQSLDVAMQHLGGVGMHQTLSTGLITTNQSTISDLSI